MIPIADVAPLYLGVQKGFFKAEKLTIVPIIEAFHARHHIENMIIVADAGMLSAANLTTLDKAGFAVSTGSAFSTRRLAVATWILCAVV